MKDKYTCPMHPEIQENEPGKCPKCGMDLTKENGGNTHVNISKEKPSYRPLIVIISLILFTTIALSLRDSSQGVFNIEKSMSYFMAGFFLIFAGFKLLDLKGFAHAYATYDLLAKYWPQYGYIYPFIELSFGIAYLYGDVPEFVNRLALIVMIFSGLGVLQALRQKRKFECACLGTIIKVPLTSVTLIEDFGMATMAAISLLM